MHSTCRLFISRSVEKDRECYMQCNSRVWSENGLSQGKVGDRRRMVVVVLVRESKLSRPSTSCMETELPREASPYCTLSTRPCTGCGARPTSLLAYWVWSNFLVGLPDVEQDQLPCWLTATFFGNCQVTETHMVLASHAPWQPLRNHSSGHLTGGWGGGRGLTPWSAEE